MLGQFLSLRLIETNSVCQKCAKLLHTHRTVNFRLKNNHSVRNSEHNQEVRLKNSNSGWNAECSHKVRLKNNHSANNSGHSRNNRESESIVFEDHFKFQNHRQKYDSRSDVSLKLSKWPSVVTISQRNYGIPVAINCRNLDQTSNFRVRNHHLNIDTCAFHTSSVHYEDDTGRKTPDLNETMETIDSIQNNSGIAKETNQSHNDNVGETSIETDVQSIVKANSVDIDTEKHASKGTEANATMEETEQMSKKVAQILSYSNTAVKGELPQFDSDKQIKEFLKENDMVLQEGHTCFTTSCPKLGKVLMKTQKKKEGERLFINTTSGHFLCEHCQKSGSWSVLKDNISALRKIRKKKQYNCFENVNVREEPQTTPPEITALLQTTKNIKSLKGEEFQDLIDIFDWQGIKQTTLTKYGAKFTISEDTYSILLPVTSVKGVVVGVRKFTATQKHSDDDETHTSVRITSYPRQLSEIFGWQSVNAKSASIVITGSEVESLAIIQKTDIPSVAMKNLTYFPQELLPYLERFTKIIMWFGNDVKAWQSSKQFAKKLNDIRCHVFRPSSDLQSPLEVIQSEDSLKDMLLKARPIGHDSIVSFNKLRHEVYIELAQIEQVSGVKWKRYTPLNKIMKGHRPGELTVLTGPTGSGKTTFVSDYSLDLCTQGVNTLWGSFEISNVRLAKIMMSQFAGKSMMKNLKCFDEIADQFSDIPMFFMTYFGQEEMHNVIQAMSHAVYVHDIKHVIVDNLQFMMGMNYAEGSRFHIQDKIISMFRKFATQMNCHVTLIIHPRKEKDGEELMMSSIFGSAKAVQEADNVLILQDMRLTAASGRKYIQVMKNRFDGELGVMMLKFDKDSLRFVASQKKSSSRKKDESEDKETGDDDRTESGSKNSDGVKFKKLDQSGHSYDEILDIDKYYAS